MCSIAFASRLRSACASRSGSALRVPLGHRAELEAAVGDQAHAVPQLAHERGQLDRLGAQELALLALGEQQQVFDEPRDPRDLGLHDTRDPAHLLLARFALGGEHLDLPADHGERGAQLVGRVRDERALPLESLGQAVEHVVEGVREDHHLVALAPVVLHARVEVARVHAGRDLGHPAQRPRYARGDQQRGDQRAAEAEQRSEDERAGDAALGVLHR